MVGEFTIASVSVIAEGKGREKKERQFFPLGQSSLAQRKEKEGRKGKEIESG